MKNEIRFDCLEKVQPYFIRELEPLEPQIVQIHDLIHSPGADMNIADGLTGP